MTKQTRLTSLLFLIHHNASPEVVNAVFRTLEATPARARKRHTLTTETNPISTKTTSTVDTQRSPFVAEILNARDQSHRCLGTLVASDLVLTAAHCLYDSDIVVRLDSANDEDDSITNNTAAISSTSDSSGSSSLFLFIVQAIRTHPEYYYNTYTGGEDVDPYDVALLQLYGTIDSAGGGDGVSTGVVGLNRDASLPHDNSHLLGIGWKARNTNTITTPTITTSNNSGTLLLLEQTVLMYVPNDVCIHSKGMSSTGYRIDYESQIIDVSLCALYEQGPGLCPGDSGGPLFLYNSNYTNSQPSNPHPLFVQVGITSASYGCQNAILPTLNVRVSKVSDWIDSTVCELSMYPTPSAFGCNNSLTSLAPPLLSAAVSDEEDEKGKVELTVELGLNDKTGNLGWLLYQIVDNRSVPVDERPLLSYRELAPFSNVSETVLVANNRQYRLVVLDAQSDSSGIFLRVLSSLSQIYVSATLVTGKNAQSFAFVVGSIPTLSPSSLTPSPTVAARNTSIGGVQPTVTPPPFLTVVIALDGYPTETGFFVEALADDDDTDNASLAPVLVHATYPGSFGPQEANEEVQVVVPLLPLSSQNDNNPRRYRFTMTDNEHDGLEPPALYEVWIGPREQGTLVVRGGDFSLEDRHDFVVQEKYNFVPPTTGTAEDDDSTTTNAPIKGGSGTRCWIPERPIIQIALLLFLLINALA